MTTAERIELALVPVVGASPFMLSSLFSQKLVLGRLLLVVAALILLQSLVRDLWLLVRRASPGGSNPVRAVQCMCVESTLGVAGIVAGAVLLGTGVGVPVVMNSWKWCGLVMFTLWAGFLAKDYVIHWNPWRIRRDPDHMNIVFRWTSRGSA